MDSCNNCKRSLSCSCQKRTASNGAQCCAACLQTYEQHLQQLKEIQQLQQQTNPNP